MEQRDNYQIQALQAKKAFTGYDLPFLIRKCGLTEEHDWLCVNFLGRPYRIRKATGDIQKHSSAGWVDANSHAEVMTLLDLVCDSREDRHLSGRWKQMQSFGLLFHRNLLEDIRDPFAQQADRDRQGLERACLALGGRKLSGADVSYALPLFEDLWVWMQFWAGDEEFAPRVRWFWDDNSLMYLKYETMYFAVELLRQQLLEKMGNAPLNHV